ADLVEAAAWLHDIGYAPDLVDTGFHPLDGARYLRDTHHADPRLCNLVAHHSCAIIEAQIRGLADQLAEEFEPQQEGLTQALDYSDMTTGPDGRPVSAKTRLAEIVNRYRDEMDPVRRFIDRAAGTLTAEVEEVVFQLERAKA